MATTTKKKSPAKKKPALKKSKKVNPWLLVAGAVAVAIIGVIVVRSSFAGTKWPYWVDGRCGGVTNRIDKGTVPGTYKQGSRGDCVKLLQNGLRAAGFMNGAADGIFGPKTGDSVLLLETYYGFGVKDRVASQCTWLTIQGVMYNGKTNKARVRGYVSSQGARCW